MIEKSTIRLRRKAAIPAAFAKLTILVDDQTIGTIGNGKEEVFDVGPGQHVVKLKHSLPLTLDFETGREIKLECGIQNKALVLVIGLGLVGGLILILGTAFGVNHTVSLGIAMIPMVIVGIVSSKPGVMYYLKKVDE